jgi:hypothetical protein
LIIFNDISTRARILSSTVVVVPPLYSPAIPRPVPTGTIRTVTTSTPLGSVATTGTVANIYNSCVSGDCIQFDDGVYDWALCFPNGLNKTGVIVRAKNIGSYDVDPMGGGHGIHWARFQRKVTFEFGAGLGGSTSGVSAANVTLQDVALTTKVGLWPADNAGWNTVVTVGGNRPAMITLGNASNFKMLYCESWVGYGIAKTAYNTTTRHSDQASPASWWFALSGDYGSITGTNPGSGIQYPGHGDGTYLTVNRMAYGPTAVAADGNTRTDVTYYGNYFHDITAAIKSSSFFAGTALSQHNWFERVFADMSTITGYPGGVGAVKHFQNVYFDPVSQARDSGNPHSDTNQFFLGGSTSSFYITGPESARNILAAGRDTLGNAQFNYFQMSDGIYSSSDSKTFAVAPKIRENLGFMSGTTHGLDLGISESAYIRNNMSFHPTGLTNGQAATATPALSDSVGIYAARPNKGFYAHNLFEGSLITNAQLDTPNNVVLGAAASRLLTDATVFTSAWSTFPTSLHGFYEAARRTTGYATVGPQSANIADFLLGSMDWSSEPRHAGFATTIGTAGVLTSTNLAWVHGGPIGTVSTFVPPSGCDWRKVALDRTTQTQAWGTATGTAVTDSEYIQLRATAGTQGTSATYTGSIGSTTVTWSLAAASTAVFPQATFAATNQVGTPSNIVYDASGGTTMTLAFEITLAAAPPTNMYLLYSVTSVPAVQVQILTTRKVRIYLNNSAGVSVGFFNLSGTIAIDGTTKHTVILTVDTSKASSDPTSVIAYVNGVRDNSITYSGWTGVSTAIGFNMASRRPAVGSSFVGNLGYIYMLPNNALAITSDMVRTQFTADRIGLNGQGPSGASPPLFVVGLASSLNTANIANYGTLTMGPTGSGTVTAVSGTWP